MDKKQSLTEIKAKDKECGLEEFKELASLLNVTLEEIKDECCMYQITKLSQKLGKVIVRYNLTDKDIEKTLNNCNALGVGEILLSPAYIPAINRQLKKTETVNKNVNVIIDFPFGESLYKSKMTELKNCVKLGVKQVTVMMPQIILSQKNLKAFKKQVKAIGKTKKAKTGIALPAMEMNEANIKTAFKIICKTKVDFVTMVFSEASVSQVKQQLELVNKYRDRLPIKVMANLSEIEGVKELIANNVQNILTPFAEEIGQKLIERFNIKKVKLC